MEYTVGGWRVWLTVESRDNPTKLVTQQDHAGHLCSVAQVKDQQSCDGIIVTRSDASAAIHTADCLSLVITTDEKALLLHLSRKTLLTPLLPTALKKVAAEKVTGVFLGPHICAQHLVYEYEGEEILAFKKAFPRAWQALPGGTSLSLKIASEEVLYRALSSSTPTIVDGRCTYEDPSLPSYRRWLEGGKQGELQHLFTRASKI